MNYDELLYFLINDIQKTTFFHNAKFGRFVELNRKVKIKKELINNIINQYIQEKKIKTEDDF